MHARLLSAAVASVFRRGSAPPARRHGGAFIVDVLYLHRVLDDHVLRDIGLRDGISRPRRNHLSEF